MTAWKIWRPQRSGILHALATGRRSTARERFSAERLTLRVTAERILLCRGWCLPAARFTQVVLITGRMFAFARRRLQRMRRPMEPSVALERRRAFLPWSGTWIGSRAREGILGLRFGGEIFCNWDRPPPPIR